MKVLVTGGAGYIGSTVVLALGDRGHDAVVLDDLSTGRREFTRGVPFYEGDVADPDLLDAVFADHPGIDATVHCAAAIVVPDSVAHPDFYYDNNVGKTIRLIANLRQHQERPAFLFSSSASIYAPSEDFSVTEESPITPTSPYASTKAMVERVLQDCAHAGLLRAVSLRYFNPIGADPSMRTGLQLLHPSHVLGKLVEAYETGHPFSITGVDWPTADGSGIRDYIHVWDLALAHVAALESFDPMMQAAAEGDFLALNVGTGAGTSVRELVETFSEVAGKPIPAVEAPRRPGDAVGAFARTDRITQVLGWTPTLTIADGIRDSLQWRRIWLDLQEPAQG